MVGYFVGAVIGNAGDEEETFFGFQKKSIQIEFPSSKLAQKEKQVNVFFDERNFRENTHFGANEIAKLFLFHVHQQGDRLTLAPPWISAVIGTSNPTWSSSVIPG